MSSIVSDNYFCLVSPEVHNFTITTWSMCPVCMEAALTSKRFDEIVESDEMYEICADTVKSIIIDLHEIPCAISN